MITYEAFLRNSAVPRQVIDTFLDQDQASWAQFDPELGYILGNALTPDGIDGSLAITTSQPNGARTSMIYRDHPGRINTYGDSFTQCSQVSDGETWQEYLAAHLGEPIRNYGVGGYGVYQAYRRMLRTEQTEDGADYVILYIWGDDHFRSVMRCRHTVIYPWWDNQGGFAFHNNFWANIEMDLESGHFVETENLLPTPESLYRMTDLDFIVEAQRDDLMVQLHAFSQYDPQSIDFEPINTLARILGVPAVDDTDVETLAASIKRIEHAYGFAATKLIIDKAVAFCEAHGKKLLFCLLCPTATRQLLHSQPRYEQAIADYLQAKDLLTFDMNLAHLDDYQDFNLSVEDYMNRYYIGHYKPIGNHLFAFTLKDTVIEWLDPKPVTYDESRQPEFDYTGYLPR